MVLISTYAYTYNISKPDHAEYSLDTKPFLKSQIIWSMYENTKPGSICKRKKEILFVRPFHFDIKQYLLCSDKFAKHIKEYDDLDTFVSDLVGLIKRKRTLGYTILNLTKLNFLIFA